MKKFFFILRTYNDIDHITPIIWKYAKQGNTIDVYINGVNDLKNDVRLQLIQKFNNVELNYSPDFLHEKFSFSQGSEQNFLKLFFKKFYFKSLSPNNILGKFFFKFFFNCKKEYDFLKKKNYDAMFVEWSPPYQRGLKFIKFIKSAKGIGIPIICLPHGLNIYINSDIHQNFKKNIIKGKILNQSDFNIYDYIFVQSKFHAKHFSSFGIKKNKIIVAGSLRFCPEWMNVLKEFSKKFNTKINSDNKKKIVFMLPHWIYNVNKQATINLIKKISEIQNIYLVIKNHTRADTGLFPKSEKTEQNVEVIDSVSSSSLIDWSEIVINFGSSIGIEAILKNKKLVCPSYLQENDLAFKYSNLTNITNSDEETLNEIINFSASKVSQIKDEAFEKDGLINNTVYAPNINKDVINFYIKKIDNIISRNTYSD